MDIIDSVADQGLNEEGEAGGLDPVAISNQYDRLRGVAGRLQCGWQLGLVGCGLRRLLRLDQGLRE